MPSSVAVTRITHSSHLIEIADQRILTDPGFSTPATYYPGEANTMSPLDLPHLDAVHLATDHVKEFRAALPSVSPSCPGDLVQLIEVPIA